METNKSQSQSSESEMQLIKKEKREQKRIEEEKLMESYERKIKLKKFLRVGIFVLAVVVFSGAGVFFIFNNVSEKPGEEIPIQPADHIMLGDPITGIYLTNPPVSGWHYEEKTSWGIHDEEIKDQILLSTIEKGGVWISYTPDSPPEVIEGLKKIVKNYSDDDVILTPRTANDSLIALVAWGRLDKFNYFDEARIVKFIKAYK